MTMNDVANSELEQHRHEHEHGKGGRDGSEGCGGGGGGGDESKLDFILAAPSHDMWSFGALLFYMAVNAPLIHRYVHYSTPYLLHFISP